MGNRHPSRPLQPRCQKPACVAERKAHRELQKSYDKMIQTNFEISARLSKTDRTLQEILTLQDKAKEEGLKHVLEFAKERNADMERMNQSMETMLENFRKAKMERKKSTDSGGAPSPSDASPPRTPASRSPRASTVPLSPS